MKTRLILKAILLLVVIALSTLLVLESIKINEFRPSRSDPEAQKVLIIANRNSPISLRVAQYYQQRRGIPPNNFLTLDLPDSTLTPGFESISYSTYQKQVEQPLRNFLTRQGLADGIRYIVLTKGVPLRIKDIPYRLSDGQPFSQHQSVDSTLAALDYRVAPIEIKDPEYKKMVGTEIFGLLTPNLYWRQAFPFEHQRTGGYLVTRLDGYREADARALVDRALIQRPQLTGTVLLDSAINDESSGESQVVDIYDPKICTPQVIPKCTPLPKAMIEATQKDMNNDLRLAFEQSQKTLTNLHVTQAPPRTFVEGQNLIAYASWGSNDEVFDPQNYHDLQFIPGAIAETFVSTSGRTFFPTLTGQSLIGDLIAPPNGVTGIRGYIEEPELQGMGSPTILFGRYLNGANLATAYYQSIRYIGWRDIVLGDPLTTVVFNP